MQARGWIPATVITLDHPHPAWVPARDQPCRPPWPTSSLSQFRPTRNGNGWSLVSRCVQAALHPACRFLRAFVDVLDADFQKQWQIAQRYVEIEALERLLAPVEQGYLPIKHGRHPVMQ